MEKITGYLILVLGSSLVLLRFVALSEKSGKPIRNSLTKNGKHPQPNNISVSEAVKTLGVKKRILFFAIYFRELLERIPLLIKVNREMVIKGLVVTGFILFSRKLIYYVRFDGVIQTKSSIWWIDGNAHTILVISIVVFFLIGLGWQLFKTDIEGLGCWPALVSIVILAIIWSFVINSMFNALEIQLPITGRHLPLIIFAPLLELKILCSGKYLGLLTCFLVGYFMAAGYEKLTPGIRKPHVKIMIVTELMFIIFLGFSFFKALGSPGDWEQQVNKKVLSVTGETDMMNLVDAAHSIDHEQTRHQILERIIAQIIKEKQFRWEKEIYQRVIGEVLTFYGYRRRNLLKKIALWIADNGDIPWAEEVAMSIQAKNIRNKVLKEIRQRIEKK